MFSNMCLTQVGSLTINTEISISSIVFAALLAPTRETRNGQQNIMQALNICVIKLTKF